MDPLGFREVQCPYCGERIEIQVDGSAGEQSYVEDCSVCCRPIEMRVFDAGGGMVVEVRRDDE
jgi:hypothetical protein